MPYTWPTPRPIGLSGPPFPFFLHYNFFVLQDGVNPRLPGRTWNLNPYFRSHPHCPPPFPGRSPLLKFLYQPLPLLKFLYPPLQNYKDFFYNIGPPYCIYIVCKIKSGNMFRSTFAPSTVEYPPLLMIYLEPHNARSVNILIFTSTTLLRYFYF